MRTTSGGTIRSTARIWAVSNKIVSDTVNTDLDNRSDGGGAFHGTPRRFWRVLRVVAAQDFTGQAALMLAILIEHLAGDDGRFDAFGLGHKPLAAAGQIPHVFRIFGVHRVWIEEGQVGDQALSDTTALWNAKQISRDGSEPTYSFFER